MDTTTAINNFLAVQNIFRLISVLQITDHMWPLPAHVEDDASYDFIIVGGGTAGCVIANSLAKLNNVSVLLVEAGGNPPLESIYPGYFIYPKHSLLDWNVTSTIDRSMRYHKGGVADITQGKVLGGSSSINYMAYSRGTPSDYDNWAALTNDSTWSFESILPLFIRSERVIDKNILGSPDDRVFHGTKGHLTLRKYYYKVFEKYFCALEELGNKILIDINARNPLGYTNSLFITGLLRRSSTADAFLRPVKNNRFLHVLTNALVTKINFDDDKNAVGVEIRTQNGKTITVKAKKEVILSAGTFKSPQLLMVSGIGPKQHLRRKNITVIKDLPVGKNLQDHPICVLPYKMGDSNTPTTPPNPHNIGIPVINGYVALNKSQNYPDYEILSLILDDPEIFLVTCGFLFSFKNEICDNLIKGADGKQIYFVFSLLSYPESRGQVLLNTTNMADQPIVNLGYYSNDKDVETHIKLIVHFNEILNSTYFRSVNAELIDPKLKSCARFKKGSHEYWRCYVLSMVTTGSYFVGTCAMGQVVDSRLLVKGVHRLRVADASIMPVIVGSTTQATVVMIAQKASDLIIEEHGLK